HGSESFKGKSAYWKPNCNRRKRTKINIDFDLDAESVTELIKTESQQIQLIVNEQDKKLRMETI
ncbi:hypothetical protein Q536_01053, partial [Staphylococcus aureus M1479]|uniref:hypothetical protein n=1 Tax=Staphylococcus aureus TaxID=1280 RepID=UPI000446428C